MKRIAPNVRPAPATHWQQAKPSTMGGHQVPMRLHQHHLRCAQGQRLQRERFRDGMGHFLGRQGVDSRLLRPHPSHAETEGEPLPKPLRAHAQGPHGEEHQAGSATGAERWTTRVGSKVRGLLSPDLCPPDGVLHVRGGVQAQPATRGDLDHEACGEVSRQGDFSLRQAPPNLGLEAGSSLASKPAGGAAATRSTPGSRGCGGCSGWGGPDRERRRGESERGPRALRSATISLRSALGGWQEVRFATLRPRNQLHTAYGLHVPQWLRTVLARSLLDGCC
mmetsp:Transcript_25494/g.54060  ORF Transcript_25494/g.54060 Transcript_25494/m.54060 type:complete len:279 (+) Transcript_25494:190-1026(+)